MGRDWQKEATAKKTKQIAVRVSDEEKARMEEFARNAGYHSLSDWARRLMQEDMAHARKKGNPGR